ncbi:ArsR/SmtB family transcription factor [Serinicoccus sediminis]|uniref:ArsR/SmtB family transcription factor n=1 Tax=Serinicoccus sediminis TaxID=2306021 RepID=UPI00101EA722|nr:metalloregulator ArsR/SmtB family transcription factor [Serinicoccus sediminis]
MTALDVLGDPVRRRLLEHLALAGELSAGGLVTLVQEDFAVSQPAVSQHLRVLRESGVVSARAEGRRRVYRLEAAPLAEAERWLAELRGFWSQRLDALETEVVRGRLSRRADDRTDEADTADHTTRRMA